jgi:hypothetical protein
MCVTTVAAVEEAEAVEVAAAMVAEAMAVEATVAVVEAEATEAVEPAVAEGLTMEPGRFEMIRCPYYLWYLQPFECTFSHEDSLLQRLLEKRKMEKNTSSWTYIIVCVCFL